MNSLDYTLSRDDSDDEIPVTVEYDYIPEERGSRDEAGRQMEPDYPEDVELVSVKDKNGNELTLSKTELESVIEACFKDVEDIKENRDAAWEDCYDTCREEALFI